MAQAPPRTPRRARDDGGPGPADGCLRHLGTSVGARLAAAAAGRGPGAHRDCRHDDPEDQGHRRREQRQPVAEPVKRPGARSAEARGPSRLARLREQPERGSVTLELVLAFPLLLLLILVVAQFTM